MKTSEIKSGVVFSYISIALDTIVALIYTPIMLRLLGQSEYGLYNLVNSFVAYLGLMDFGFTSTYMRFYSQKKHIKSENEIASLNGMFFCIFLLISICVAFLGSIFVMNSNAVFGTKLTIGELSSAKKILVLLVASSVLAFMTKIFEVYVNANERFVFPKLLNIFHTITNPFVTIPLLLAGYKSLSLAIVALGYQILTLIVNIVFCFGKLNMKLSFKQFDLSLLKGIVGFSVFVFIGEIVDMMNWNVDKYILGRMKGTISVAIYGVAAQISTYYRFFSTSISSVFTPRVNRIVAVERDSDSILTDLLIKVGRIQFLVLALVASGIIFFGKTFFVLWAGEEYTNAYVVALFLIIPTIIPLIQSIGPNILLAKDKHKFRSILYLAIALTNVALSIPLCRYWGEVGCAVGTAIAIVVGNGLIINIYYTRLGLDVRKFWFQIISMVKGLIPSVVVGIIVLLVGYQPNWGTFFLLVCGYSLVYCVSMYLFSMNTYERELVLNFGRKALSILGIK